MCEKDKIPYILSKDSDDMICPQCKVLMCPFCIKELNSCENKHNNNMEFTRTDDNDWVIRWKYCKILNVRDDNKDYECFCCHEINNPNEIKPNNK